MNPTEEEDRNRPWDWIDDLRFLFFCVLAGLAVGIGLAVGRFFSTF